MTPRSAILYALHFFALFTAATATLASAATANDGPIKVYEVEGEYGEMRSFVKDAIINQGYNIDYNGKIGDMLKRTRGDVGSAKKLYKDAEFFLFCSAKFSRATMEANLHNIGYCPYIVFVYESVAKPGWVTVGYRRPTVMAEKGSLASLKKVEDILENIVREAIE